MRMKNLVPMLNVSNIEKSLDFYKSAVGFEVISDPAIIPEWRWAAIRSGQTELMLSQTETGVNLSAGSDPHKNTSWPVVFYFYPDDVKSLHQHIEKCGYQPTEVIVTHYGMREFSLQDPDGHLLSFGEDGSK